MQMSMEVFSKRKKRIGEWLISEKVISQEQLERALEVKEHNSKKLGEIIVDLGFCSEEVIVDVLSRKLNFDKVSVAAMKIDEEILALASGQILRKYDGFLNISEEDGCFSLKMLIPIQLIK